MTLGAMAADCAGCGAVKAVSAAGDGGSVWWTVVVSGIVDGFNPCAFSVAIALAGILAAGGRRPRARILGGWAFCCGSFLTYMAMGVGFLHALRALDGFRTARTAFATLLALGLFACSYLSLRDAWNYRRLRSPSAIVLQLPGRVKGWIRSVAESSWRGPSVIGAGLLCGVVVTLLDSLCTGQVYIPVLALVAREPRAWRALAYLTVYNLAFILPLVAVFLLAARGADAVTLSGWSKRNVVPAKLALALVFLVLGLLIMPRFGGSLAEALGHDVGS